MTKEQQTVVDVKIHSGYEIVGTSKSINNGLDVFILTKGKHTIAINSLGYDEHYKGKTWKLNSGNS